MQKVILGGLLFLSLGTGGCGIVQDLIIEKVIETQTGENVDINTSSEDGISIQTDEGDFNLSTGDDIALPDDFPNDVFVYKNAKVQMAMNLPQGQSASFVTKESAASVKKTYQKEMAKNGWSEEMSMDMGGQSTFGFKKQERYSQIVVIEEDNQTLINVIISNEQ